MDSTVGLPGNPIDKFRADLRVVKLRRAFAPISTEV